MVARGSKQLIRDAFVGPIIFTPAKNKVNGMIVPPKIIKTTAPAAAGVQALTPESSILQNGNKNSEEINCPHPISNMVGYCFKMFSGAIMYILREIIHQLILPVDAPGQLPCPAVPGVAAETVQKRRLQTEGNIQRQRPLIPRHRRIRTGPQPVPDLLLLHIRQHRRDRRNIIDRFLQLIPGAQVEMILRHHVPGVGDHIVDEFLKTNLLLPLADMIQNRLKPEQLVALRLVIEEAG